MKYINFENDCLQFFLNTLSIFFLNKSTVKELKTQFKYLPSNCKSNSIGYNTT